MMTGQNTVELAGDALYDAYRALQNAVDLIDGGLREGNLRSRFVEAIRTVCVYVASADGGLSAEDGNVIDQLLWLDPADNEPIGRALHQDVTRAEHALAELRAMALAVDTAAERICKRRGPQSNEVVRAVDEALSAIVGADPSTANYRSSSVLESLRSVLPAQQPTAYPEAQPVPAPASIATAAPQEPEFPTVPCPARLRDGESCFAVGSVTLYQESNVVRRVRYAGLSARVGIMRGLSYRSGSYNVDRTRAPKTECIANGTLCVTDQRLIFLSDVKNLDLPYARLLACSTRFDAIEVRRSNSGRLIFEHSPIRLVRSFERLTGTRAAALPSPSSNKRSHWLPTFDFSGRRVAALCLAAGMIVMILVRAATLAR
jgi:hypothetical protein